MYVNFTGKFAEEIYPENSTSVIGTRVRRRRGPPVRARPSSPGPIRPYRTRTEPAADRKRGRSEHSFPPDSRTARATRARHSRHRSTPVGSTVRTESSRVSRPSGGCIKRGGYSGIERRPRPLLPSLCKRSRGATTRGRRIQTAVLQ